MRLLSFRAGGAIHFGAVVGDGVVDLTRRLGPELPSLRSVLAAGKLDRARAAIADARPDRALSTIDYAPTIPDPDKILCVGLNYKSHVAEMTREMPKQPSVFSRLHSTLNAHQGTMRRPQASSRMSTASQAGPR